MNLENRSFELNADSINFEDKESKFNEELDKDEFNLSNEFLVDNIEPIGDININEICDDCFSDVSSIENNEKEIFSPININIEKEVPMKPIECRRKRRTREDLNKTPLPIFDCIYCSNETVVYNHMSKELISDQYLYNCSTRDSFKIYTILSTPIILNSNLDMDIQHLIHFIIRNTEYLHRFYKEEKIHNRNLIKVINQNTSNKAIRPNLKYKFTSNENTLSLNKISLAHKLKSNSMNENKCLSKIYGEISENFSNLQYNSLNFQKYDEELLLKNNQHHIEKEQEKANLKNESESKIKEDLELESQISDSENDINNYNTNYDNNESFLGFLKFDLKRKITKNDISWETEVQDIWNPKLSDLSSSSEENLLLNVNSELEAKKKVEENKNENLFNYRNYCSDENLSLQLSENSSNINNLFDTNSNLNIKFNHCVNDRSINNQNNSIQFKTVISYNSDLQINEQNENSSIVFNKSDPEKNGNSLNTFKIEGINDNPKLNVYSSITCKKKFLLQNHKFATKAKENNSNYNNIPNKPKSNIEIRNNTCYLNSEIRKKKYSRILSKDKNKKYDSLNDFSRTQDVHSLNNGNTGNENTTDDKIKFTSCINNLTRDGKFCKKLSQDFKPINNLNNLAKSTSNFKKNEKFKFSEFSNKFNSINNFNKFDSYSNLTDRSHNYISPANSSKFLLYSTKNSSYVINSSSVNYNSSITMDVKINNQISPINSNNNLSSCAKYKTKFNNSLGISFNPNKLSENLFSKRKEEKKEKLGENKINFSVNSNSKIRKSKKFTIKFFNT